ncbi:MAG: hypothetical protein ACLFQ5_07730 [Oceanicaulis sp.]
MKCANCFFFHEDGQECRRYAPTPSDQDRKAEWPNVAASDWCGEYREDPAKTERKTA